VGVQIHCTVHTVASCLAAAINSLDRPVSPSCAAQSYHLFSESPVQHSALGVLIRENLVEKGTSDTVAYCITFYLFVINIVLL